MGAVTGRAPAAVATPDVGPPGVALSAIVPPGAPILFDSSALLSYLDGSEPVSPIATAILDGWVRSGRNDGFVSAVSVMEVLVRPIAAGPSAHRSVIGFLYGFPHLRLIALDAIAGQLAASLRASAGFSSVDALVVATGLAVGARHVVTNDVSWRTRLREAWPEVTVVTLAELAEIPAG